jgi:hypothetical protein
MQMALADELPLSETLGVFVGVAGFDWLADGNAEPLKAVIVAVAAGGILLVAKLLLKHRRKD